MEKPDRIHLRDHVLSAEIGAFQSERGRVQRLRFTISVDLADAVSGSDDQVDRILSYDVLTQAVDTALSDRRYALVETLAEKIAAEILAHPAAARVKVSVEKLDRGPGALGITISRDAPRVAATLPDLPCELLVWRAPTEVPRGAVVILPAIHDPAPPSTSIARRRIALLTLDQAAWALAERIGLEIAETRTELDAAIHDRRPVIWAPARLAADDAAAGETAETIAFWLAARMPVRRIAFSLAEPDPLPVAPDGLAVTICRA